MEDSTFAVEQSPIDFTSEAGSDSISSSGNSSSSSLGDDLDVETLIQSIHRKLLRQQKPRRKRCLKEIHETGVVDKKLKLEKPKGEVVLPPGFLQPLFKIDGPLDGKDIDSSRKQSLNSGDYGSSKPASSSFLKAVARKRGRPKKNTPGKGALPSKKSKAAVTRKRGRPKKNTASGKDALPSKKSTSSFHSTLNMTKHDNPSVEAAADAAAAALDTNAALKKDELDLIQKKLKEAENLEVVLVSILAEERRKAAEEEDKLRKRLMEASETIEALSKKLMWYRTSSGITSSF